MWRREQDGFAGTQPHQLRWLNRSCHRFGSAKKRERGGAGEQNFTGRTPLELAAQSGREVIPLRPVPASARDATQTDT
jgi:hypothetical protein